MFDDRDKKQFHCDLCKICRFVIKHFASLLLWLCICFAFCMLLIIFFVTVKCLLSALKTSKFNQFFFQINKACNHLSTGQVPSTFHSTMLDKVEQCWAMFRRDGQMLSTFCTLSRWSCLDQIMLESSQKDLQHHNNTQQPGQMRCIFHSTKSLVLSNEQSRAFGQGFKHKHYKCACFNWTQTAFWAYILLSFLRIGGKENFFHCVKCDMCLAIHLQGSHKVDYSLCYFLEYCSLCNFFESLA